MKGYGKSKKMIKWRGGIVRKEFGSPDARETSAVIEQPEHRVNVRGLGRTSAKRGQLREPFTSVL